VDIMADAEWQDVGAAADLAARSLTEITLGHAKLALSHRNGVLPGRDDREKARAVAGKGAEVYAKT